MRAATSSRPAARYHSRSRPNAGRVVVAVRGVRVSVAALREVPTPAARRGAPLEVLTIYEPPSACFPGYGKELLPLAFDTDVRAAPPGHTGCNSALTTAERAIYARRRRRTLQRLAAAGALTVIVVALYRAELRIPYLRELVVFSAPGAVLGLAVTWAGHLFRQRSFTWRTGLIGAGLGALLLPPVLAAIVVLNVFASPGAALRLFVLGAWAAIAGGPATALLLAVSRLVRRTLIRPRAVEPPRASSAT